MSEGLSIKIRKTELITPNGTTFICPGHYGTYAQVMEKIDVAGLKRPTFIDTIVLAHAAWQNPDEKHSRELIDLIGNDGLVADTGLLYLPEKGVYVQDHPETDEKGWVVMNEENLASRLKDGDPSVRFAPFGYKIEIVSLKQLTRSSFIKALTGSNENAQMVAELAYKYTDKPYVGAFDACEVVKPMTRVAALYEDAGLNIDGSGCGHGDGNYSAFGIRPKSEA